MSAAAKVYSNLADIDLSVGAQRNLEVLSFQFIEEHCHFHAFCQAELAYNAIQILSFHAVEIQIFFLKISDNAFSIQKQDALCQNTSHDLILDICLLIEGFINDLTEVESCFHQFAGDAHGFR